MIRISKGLPRRLYLSKRDYSMKSAHERFLFTNRNASKNERVSAVDEWVCWCCATYHPRCRWLAELCVNHNRYEIMLFLCRSSVLMCSSFGSSQGFNKGYSDKNIHWSQVDRTLFSFLQWTSYGIQGQYRVLRDLRNLLQCSFVNCPRNANIFNLHISFWL